VYLFLVRDPVHQLVTEQWPAPAVAQWKAVAEVFTVGAGHLPPGALGASAIAAGCGVALTLLERSLGRTASRWVPSATSVGLAFVLPAHYSLSAFAGAGVALLIRRWRPVIHERFGTVVAAGLIAGESLVGVALALAVWQ
jgi:uncharacterized oligopeptide transporter (OPT) family protein